MGAHQWLRTPAAAIELCCSQNHLKRCRDTHGAVWLAAFTMFWDLARLPRLFGMLKLLGKNGISKE